MKDDQLDDLKQFIAATVSQSEARLQDEIIAAVSGSEGRLRKEFHTEVSSLRTEMADGFAGIAEAIESVLKQAEERDVEVDRRFSKLEQQAA